MGVSRRSKRSQPPIERIFATKSHAWRELGLARQISQQAARRARWEVGVLIVLFVGVLIVYGHRRQLFGHGDTPVQIVTVIVLVVLGWWVARDAGRALGPILFRRMDPANAGTVGFLIRLVTLAIAILAALQIAGITPRTLAVGGAVTAVVLGLAAQQTLGNLIAGTVLLSARPFRVGDRIKLQAGQLAGSIEGVVSSLGLLYTTLTAGEDEYLVPNSLVLTSVVMPRREPASVDVRARLAPGTRPSELQELLHDAISVRTRAELHIGLEEVDADAVVMRISATPELASDGPRLADEILAAIAGMLQDDGSQAADGSLSA